MNQFIKKKSNHLKKIIYIILTLCFFISCGHKYNQSANTETPIEKIDSTEIKSEEPFKLTVIYTAPVGFYNMTYEITERELKVINIRYDSKQSIVYETQLSQDIFDELSMVNIDSLKEYYSNPMMDGFSISVNLRNKTVVASNYYLPEIGFIVETINKSIPEKYKIWYNKKNNHRTRKM